MPQDLLIEIDDMPSTVKTALTDLAEAAIDSFQDDLSSIVLFGSGAEGRLRRTSDVNLLFLLKRFRQERADDFREPLRVAHVAVKAATMFILESELEAAAELFAVKFSDIAHRHRVLYGELPAALQAISPVARRRQLREILMNLTLRLRRAYVITSLREEQLATIIAETAGSLRTAASTLLELEGQPPASPKESLICLAHSLDDRGGGEWDDMLARISEARESGCLPAGVAVPVLSRIMVLVEIMRQRAEKTA